MRKTTIFAVILSILLVSSPVYAVGIGAKAMGMGGAYTALSRDITAAYWNPAGLIHAGLLAGDGMVGLGYEGNVTIDRFTEVTDDPAKYLEDNWEDALNVDVGANGIIGFSVRGIGVSYIPWADAYVDKSVASTTIPVSTPDISLYGKLKHAIAVTFGSKLGLFPLMSPISLGANLRFMSGELWLGSHVGGPVPPVPNLAYLSYATGSGIGLDVGAQMDVIPTLTVGLALRNLMTGFEWRGQTESFLVNPDTGQLISTGVKTDYSEAEREPTHVVLGVASQIPMIATLSADLDMYSVEDDGSKTDIRLGAESGLFTGIFTPRAGYYTENGGEISRMTLGLGFGLGPVHIDFAYGWDTEEAENTFVMFSGSGAL